MKFLLLWAAPAYWKEALWKFIVQFTPLKSTPGSGLQSLLAAAGFLFHHQLIVPENGCQIPNSLDQHKPLTWWRPVISIILAACWLSEKPPFKLLCRQQVPTRKSLSEMITPCLTQKKPANSWAVPSSFLSECRERLNGRTGVCRSQR